MATITVTPIWRDDFNRQLYKNKETKEIYVDIDDVEGYGKPPSFSGKLYTITGDEPDSPLKSEIIIEHTS